MEMNLPEGYELDSQVAPANTPSLPTGYVLDQGMTLPGLAKNAGSDIAGIGRDIKDIAQSPAVDIMSGDIGSALPKIAHQAGEFWENPKENLEAMAKPVTHPIEYGYEHPVSQAMNVMGATGLGEGALDTAGEYSKRFGQNQAMKAMGASSGQIGQVGIPESRMLAQSMIDKGVISPLRGPLGLEEKVDQLHNRAGENIESARKSADLKGGAPQMSDILQQVKNNLENKYTSGVNKGMPALNKAREEIARGGTGTFQGNAQKATDLNTYAAQNKIYRPQTASTDVADTISHMNNEAMGKVLTPPENIKYTQARTDYGNLSKVKQFLERGERREMGGRGGSSLTKTIADKTMDAIGNRTAASVGSGLGDILQTQNLPKGLAAYLMSKDTVDDRDRE